MSDVEGIEGARVGSIVPRAVKDRWGEWLKTGKRYRARELIPDPGYLMPDPAQMVPSYRIAPGRKVTAFQATGNRSQVSESRCTSRSIGRDQRSSGIWDRF
jgi:hypothetical protein